jgi:hypothetical protein
MKSDNTWDLGTEGGQQRLLIPASGVTAAYAEQAHKVTLNASSDMFARCSKLQTLATRSRFFFASTHFHAQDPDDQAEELQMCGFPAACFHRWAVSAGAKRYGFLPLTCPMLETVPLNDNASATIIPVPLFHRPGMC